MKTLFRLLFLTFFSITTASSQTDPSMFSGMQARSIGPAGMSGRIADLAVVDANPDIIYVGAATGGGKGALIGSAVGAGAGTAGAAATGKLDITIPAETRLSFKLTESVTVQVKG